MASIRQQKPLINQLINAARGQWSPPARSAAAQRQRLARKLPCFALQQHHVGQLTKSDASRGSTVATPSDFHAHLCNQIRNAQDRVILASLYIGVGSNNIFVHPASSSEPTVDGTHQHDNVNCKEDDLLGALHHAACNNKVKKMQVLLDANRALRSVSITNKNRQSHGAPSTSNNSDGQKIQTTNSAEAVFSRMNPYLSKFPKQQNNSNGLFLFPVNDQRLCSLLPSPLDEVAGVFHIKAYIVDDELILSGANLSEEYFSNRLDRYMIFTNGGGGLVDFYANLCNTLCEYAVRYDGHTNYYKDNTNNLSSFFSLKDETARKEKLETSLMKLFGGNAQSHELEDGSDENNHSSTVAYAIPTFQMPTSFLGRPFRFHSDSGVTRNLLLSALDSEQSISVRLSSAYLNLTPKLLSVLTMYGKEKGKGAPYILTAGAISHGFAPKKTDISKKTQPTGIVDRIKAAVPVAFLTLVKETAQHIIACRGKVLLYERPGWTFHAKGVWITADDGDEGGSQHDKELINNPSSLLGTIVGSGNYGARSEDLDVESNCIIVFNSSNCDANETKGRHTLKENVAAEWNNMCDESNEITDVKMTENKDNRFMSIVLDSIKRFL